MKGWMRTRGLVRIALGIALFSLASLASLHWMAGHSGSGPAFGVGAPAAAMTAGQDKDAKTEESALFAAPAPILLPLPLSLAVTVLAIHERNPKYLAVACPRLRSLPFGEGVGQ